MIHDLVIMLGNWIYLITDHKSKYPLYWTIGHSIAQVIGPESWLFNHDLLDFDFLNIVTLRYNALMDIFNKSSDIGRKNMPNKEVNALQGFHWPYPYYPVSHDMSINCIYCCISISSALLLIMRFPLSRTC